MKQKYMIGYRYYYYSALEHIKGLQIDSDVIRAKLDLEEAMYWLKIHKRAYNDVWLVPV